jgi:hypothetical protein
MKRAPGLPEQKLSYLKNLDEDQFLFLVADILYFIFDHREVKILDGPGDGRRDIRSYNKERELCITQCKFHKNYDRSVSSRETDDIVIALSKFNTKNGIFATTGKLSSQAKREYLDNFKNYKLIFLEGTDIVDLVLSSSILTSVWVNNESIELSTKTLALPFILRNIKDDVPIKSISTESLPDNLKIIETSISQDYFYPYRRPSFPSLREPGLFLTCFNLIYQGPIKLQSIHLLIESLTEKILHLLEPQFSVISLRIGISYIKEDIGNENKGKLKIESQPLSYIICNGKIFKEKDYIIPVNHSQFVFPKRLGTIEASLGWAAWFLPANDICLQVYLVAQYDIRTDTYNYARRETYLQKLNESLFFLPTKVQYDQLFELLKEEDWPDWICEYGHDGKVVGWLHPHILNDKEFTDFKQIGDSYILKENEIKLKEFTEKLLKIQERLGENNYKICPAKKAISLSAASSRPLYIEPSSQSYETAYLFRSFEDIESPLDINERFCNYICVWDIPNYDFSELIIRQILNLISDRTTDPIFEIITTSRMSKSYAKLEIEFTIPVEYPTVDFLNICLKDALEIINLVEKVLTIRYPGATRKTEFYYKYEYGILFS